MGELIDKNIGRKVEKLTVVKFLRYDVIGNRKRKIYLCKCDCGCMKEYSSDALYTVKSCGCMRKRRDVINTRDLTGMKFGELTVVSLNKTLTDASYNKFKSNKSTTCRKYWNCLCVCGNTCVVDTSSLTTGNTSTCGKCNNFYKWCMDNEKHEFITNYNYELNSDEIIDISSNTHKKYWFNCPNGLHEPHLISICHITNMDVSVCKKCKNVKSKLEERTENILIKNNIRYEPQKEFNGLTGIKGRCLSYDFYLPDYNVLIECQGGQHEKPIGLFGGEVQFLKQQVHDDRKKKYAIVNNIKLIEIWYYDKNSIEDILKNNKIIN